MRSTLPSTSSSSESLVEISRGDIANALAGQQPTKAQLASAGRGLGLRLGETSEGGGKASELPSTIRSKFHSQYPSFNFIK